MDIPMYYGSQFSNLPALTENLKKWKSWNIASGLRFGDKGDFRS